MFRLILLTLFLHISSLTIAQLILGEKKRSIHDIDLRGAVLCAATENSFELWDMNSKQLIREIKCSGNDILSSISFGYRPNEIITGSRSGELIIWDVETGERTTLLAAGNQGAVTSISNRDELIAVGFSNNTSVIYNLTTRSEIYRENRYSKDVTVVKFSNDKNVLLSGSGDGKISLSNLETGESKVVLNYSNWIRDMAISSDSSKCAIAYDKGFISVLKSNEKFQNPSEITRVNTGDWISSLDYHPSENTLAYSTFSGNVYIKMGRGGYIKKLRKNVIRIKFIPRSDDFLNLAIATRGGGLIILDAVNMKFKN